MEIGRTFSGSVRKCFSEWLLTSSQSFYQRSGKHTFSVHIFTAEPHKCSPDCLIDIDDDPLKLKGNNPLLIPMLFGWER